MPASSSDHEVNSSIERAILMTPRDGSREDFEYRIDRMICCLDASTNLADSASAFKVELLGYEGDACKRTLRFRYRLIQ